jgi:hypothetical protein
MEVSCAGRALECARLLLRAYAIAGSSGVNGAVEIVGQGDGQHAPGGGVLRAAEVEARLDAAWAFDRKLRLRQVDLVRAQHELRLRRERVGELEVDRAAARREVDQRRAGGPDIDAAGERGDRRIGALDQPVVADGLDLLEVVGVGD